MRIGIIMHPCGNQSKGLEQYVLESTVSIIREADPKTKFTVFVKGYPDTSRIPPGTIVVNLPNTFYWTLHLLLWRSRIDTFVFFTETAPFFLWKKSVIVFFDAAYYYFGSKNLFARIKRRIRIGWRRQMLRAARHVVAISQASKKDLLEKFSIPDSHVSVVYPGFRSLTKPTGTGTHDIAPSRPYFLAVGPMKERKNTLAIVEAFIRLRKTTRHTHSLVFVGRMVGGLYEKRVREVVVASGLRDAIQIKTNVEDDELSSLYTHADALVYPSLLEGFGFPILEALSLGCPVITSVATATEEVAGNAGILVDPHNTEEITDAMIQVAEKKYDREIFLKHAEAQCAQFSWITSGKVWKKIITDSLYET